VHSRSLRIVSVRKVRHPTLLLPSSVRSSSPLQVAQEHTEADTILKQESPFPTNSPRNSSSASRALRSTSSSRARAWITLTRRKRSTMRGRMSNTCMMSTMSADRGLISMIRKLSFAVGAGLGAHGLMHKQQSIWSSTTP